MKKILLSILLFPAIIHAQDIITIAGIGVGRYGGDGGSALRASLDLPYSIACDKKRNIYIADAGNNRIRKIDSAGIITTFAGNGIGDYSGDGGPASVAGLSFPVAIAIDSAGNLYIDDCFNNRIRKVDTAGIISSIAGSGIQGFSGDGGPATAAQISHPFGMALDAGGNVYIADTWNRRVREISTAGVITTVVGTGTPGNSGDGYAALYAELNDPDGLAFDNAGNLYIADDYSHSVRKVSEGIISLVAGSYVQGDSGDGGDATAAKLTQPVGMVCDSKGNLYIADFGTNRVRKVTAGGIISAYAGTGAQGFSGDGGPATAAELDHAIGITISPRGNIYVADDWNGRIREIKDAAAAVKNVQAGNNTVDIFPNPANNELTVKYSGVIEKIDIINMVGQIVYTHSHRSYTAVVSVADLPAGVYIVRINDAVVRKFIKE